MVACNGKLAVDKLNSRKSIKRLLAAIQALQMQIPITSLIQHVKGHEDSGTIMVLLRQAIMNIEMNKKVNQIVNTTLSGIQCHPSRILELFNWVM